MILFLSFSLSLLLSGDVKLREFGELHDQELAAKGTIKLSKKPTSSRWKKCIPVESIEFPTMIPPDWLESIFSKKEKTDFLNCRVGKCAFNFSSSEIEALQKMKTEEEKLKAFYEFYKNRIKGNPPPSPDRAALFLRGKDNAFEDCLTKDFGSLLDERPHERFSKRLSHIHYSSEMRPTTRLLQGHRYEVDTYLCYAEALIFSNHYDSERVEVWSLQKNGEHPELKLQVRNRIDLLNTWFRRLNKHKLRRELENQMEAQIQKAAQCLNE